MNWQDPKKYKGILVIDTDDGSESEYTHWLPLFQEYRQYSQWAPFGSGIVPCCPNVNPSTIGTSGKMSVEQLQELHAAGWEIMNHGKYHAKLAPHILSAEAASGTSDIYIDNSHYVNTNLSYYIKDGATQENVTVVSVNDGYVTIDGTLSNTYSQGSEFGLTDASLDEEVNGAKDTLEAWGVVGDNYVFAGHYDDERSRNKVAERHDSARNNAGLNSVPIADVYQLAGFLDGAQSHNDIDVFLDDTRSQGAVCIFYGHGTTSSTGLKRLRYLIEGAKDRHIRICTRKQMLQLL